MNICVHYITASEHNIFESPVSTPHKIPIFKGDRHKNFEDPMLRSWARTLANMQNGHLYWDTLYLWTGFMLKVHFLKRTRPRYKKLGSFFYTKMFGEQVFKSRMLPCFGTTPYAPLHVFYWKKISRGGVIAASHMLNFLICY